MGERRGVRRQAREAALQALFMCDFLNSWTHEAIGFCFDHFGVPKISREYAQVIATGVIDNVAKIDSRLTCASEHWSINRMARVDRGLLRLAVFEMFYLNDIPIRVAIDEAVEIAKRFGSEESPMFINGVLDRAASSLKEKIEVSVVPTAPKETDAPEITMPASLSSALKTSD